MRLPSHFCVAATSLQVRRRPYWRSSSCWPLLRALLVSSLAYFIIALIYLLKGTASSQMTGPADTRTFAIAFGLAGLLVLVLGIFWHQLRAVLFRHLLVGLPLTNLPPLGP